jgi:soluble lytic murein transglycosylase-like protein
MKKISVLLSILFIFGLHLYAEIIVKQDKDGNLTITNDYTKSYKKNRSKKRSARGITFVNSAKSKVPTKYLLKIRRLAKKYGVKDSLIIAVCRAESAFNPFAVSRKGAVGLMQLMPDTARQYGVVDRYNAEQNLDAGIRHLKYLNKKYNNNLPLVLAAYNAGEEAVKRYKGIPPYKETKNYVKIVMRYMGMTYGSGFFATKTSTKIYQYKTKDGRNVITDSYPVNAVKGSITIIE